MKIDRVEQIIKNMTLKEKIGQVTQIGYSGEDVDEFVKFIDEIKPGSLILAGTALAGSEEQRSVQGENLVKLQEYAVKNMGIPLLFGRDVIHGHRVAFPLALTMASSFDFKLVEKCFDAVRQEAVSDGVNWTFSPMLDMCRDPRWGRIVEGPGEDPYIGECFAKAAVKGFQKGETVENGAMLACLKHFVGYGASEGGRDYTQTDISDYSLQNEYLPAFRSAIENGAQTVMASFNGINGVPNSGNKKIMTDVLRGQLGFDGFVISDWDAIMMMSEYSGFAKDKRDSAGKAINAGIDMDMGGKVYLDYMESLIESGEVSEEVLDEAVRRILNVKAHFGLFEHPFYENQSFDLDEHLALSQKMAEESIVLLKNSNGILPLSKENRIGLMGPFASERRSHAGCWSLDWDQSLVHSIEDVFDKEEIKYVNSDLRLREAPQFNADCIVIALGEDRLMTGEACSVGNVSLPEEQVALLKKAKRNGLPVIGILCFARPIALEENIDLFDAVLYTGHAGSRGAEAICSVLFGDAEPQGRLPYTLPHYSGQIPVYYNSLSGCRQINSYYDDEDPRFWSYLDTTSKPLFPFGYGLSYSNLEYGEIKTDCDKIKYEDIENGEKFVFTVTVKNTGDRKAVAVGEAYVHDTVASRMRPLRQLRGIKRAEIGAGKSVEMTFELGKKDLGFYLEDGSFILEKGEFEVYIGESSICTNKTVIEVV